MSKPSIIIGDGKFAVDDSKLLGYEVTDSNKYLPKIGTVSRGSLATNVNSNGLIEDTLIFKSDELVVNGGFDTDTGWTKDAGWTISGGVATSDGTTSYIYQNGIIPINKPLKIIITISNYVSGNVSLAWGFSPIKNFSANGTFEYVSPISSTSFRILSDNFIGSIDNVSVREVSFEDIARIDYTDGEPALLVETQRTNLISYSEDFSDASWTKARASILSNQIVSPDGTINADKLVENSILNSHVVFKLSLSVTNATQYRISVFAKKSERTQLSISTNVGTGFRFDLENGTVLVGGGDIKDFGNGWYRCSYTLTTTSTLLDVYLSPSLGGVDSYQGDGISGIYIWGAQLEKLIHPSSSETSYIPTAGSTVTRLEDVINIESLSFDTAFTVFLDIDLSTSVFINNFFFFLESSSQIYLELRTNGSTLFKLFNRFTGTYQYADFPSGNGKIAIRMNGSTYDVFTAGVKQREGAALSFTLNNIELKTLYDIVLYKNIKVFNTALTDQELIDLTTL